MLLASGTVYLPLLDPHKCIGVNRSATVAWVACQIDSSGRWLPRLWVCVRCRVWPCVIAGYVPSSSRAKV